MTDTAATDSLAWHYTSPVGLQGIVTKHELWATSTAFMNDTKEFISGSELFVRKLGALRQEMSDEEFKHLDSLAHSARDDWSVPFLLSASISGDSLSLWRAYGQGEVGYAVGLDMSSPLAVLGSEEGEDPNAGPDYYDGREIELDDGTHAYDSSWDATYAPTLEWFSVSYDSEEHEEILDEALDRLVGNVRSMLSTSNPLERGIRSFHASELFQDAVQRIKDPGFRDEQECRLVARVTPAWRFVQHRPTRFGLAPYVRITGVEHPNESNVKVARRLPIREIMVGPGPYQDAAVQSLKSFLAINGYHDVKVAASEVPFR